MFFFAVCFPCLSPRMCPWTEPTLRVSYYAHQSLCRKQFFQEQINVCSKSFKDVYTIHGLSSILVNARQRQSRGGGANIPTVDDDVHTQLQRALQTRCTEGGVHDAYGRGDDLGDVSKGLQIQHTQAGIAGRFTVKYLQNDANILVKHCGLPLCRVHLAVS